MSLLSLVVILSRHSGEGPPAWMHAYKDVGGRAASGTAAEAVEPRLEQAAEESSGLFNPFPQRGNDNHRHDKPNAPPTKTRRPFTIPAPLPGFRPAPE